MTLATVHWSLFPSHSVGLPRIVVRHTLEIAHGDFCPVVLGEGSGEWKNTFVEVDS